MATNIKPAASDPKKRAFEALERRFTAARAELEHQQKQPHEEKEQILIKHSSSISSAKLKISSPSPSSEKVDLGMVWSLSYFVLRVVTLIKIM
ncbi:hypothetical protein ACLOJK_025369 [Asimina triloba]